MTPPPDESILHTLLYADIFDYPLTPSEIHYYLIGARMAPEAVLTALQSSPRLLAHTLRVNGYVTLRHRPAISDLREARSQASARLWPVARRWAAVMGSLPFVRMVAVTGALAMDNSPAGDDVDYLIVTAPGRVWLARGLSVLVVRLARLFRAGLCPNYVLAETALTLQRRNLFVAHDLAQMVPVMGHAIYARMRTANAWASEYLPHALEPRRTEPDLAPRGWRGRLKALAERLLGGRLGDALEAWERRRKMARFAHEAGQPTSAAELDVDRVKGHFDDHGQPILRQFEARVKEFAAARPETETEVRVAPRRPRELQGLPAAPAAREAPTNAGLGG
jgi:hypothetical protein